MLDRSIPTKEALVHFIPISEVKDMRSDVLRALKGSLSKKKTLNLVCGLNFNNFQERKIAWTFEFLSATFPPLGLKKKLKFVSNSVFPFITYPLLLIDFVEVYKSSFF
jgi:hypothetical protein